MGKITSTSYTGFPFRNFERIPDNQQSVRRHTNSKSLFTKSIKQKCMSVY